MRSKSLLFANIWTTLYSIPMFLIFVGSIIVEGASYYIEIQKLLFNLLSLSVEYGADSAKIIYAGMILLYVNIGLFLLGTIVGWIGFIAKKSGAALFSAIMYLLGTLCFPICALTGIPAVILGFVGYSKQKKLNNCNNIN